MFMHPPHNIMENLLGSTGNLKSQLGKRKATETDIANDAKKTRQENTSLSRHNAKKTLLHGEEQRGGLIIRRGPPTASASTSAARGNDATTSSKPHKVTTSAESSKPKSTGQTRPFGGSSKSKSNASVDRSHLVEDQRMDEDVRSMERELSALSDTLQQHARTASASRVDLPMSSSKPKSLSRQTPSNETRQPIAMDETPLNHKNKLMRAGEGRRSSSSKGKRLSSSLGNSGVITQPHPTVPTSSFHKHLDPNLPDGIRMRHLLAWCAARAMETPDAKTSTSSTSARPPLPPLSQEGQTLLRTVQEHFIKMLGEGKIATPVTMSGSSSGSRGGLREHEQNIKNRQREESFSREIERYKSEEAAWLELKASYETRRASVIANLESHAQSSRKSVKGKGREEIPPDLREDELDDRWSRGLELARLAFSSQRVKGSTNVSHPSPLSGRMEDVEFRVDQLHESAHVVSQLAVRSSKDLDARFERLSSALKFRSQPPPSGISSSVQPDPQDLLRAIAQTDLRHPQGMGEAGRIAVRELKRVGETRPAPGDEKVTPLPTTPRTPRRGGASR